MPFEYEAVTVGADCDKVGTVLRWPQIEPRLSSAASATGGAKTRVMRVLAVGFVAGSTAFVLPESTAIAQAQPPVSDRKVGADASGRSAQNDESLEFANNDDAVAMRDAVALTWVQYGAAFTLESQAAPGGLCPSQANVPCIMGSGGGVAVRVGVRTDRVWYLGGGYEFSKHDASNLLRLPIFQQARAEARRYLQYGNRISPFVTGQLGAAFYGAEWGVSTYGAVMAVGGGVEFQLSRLASIGAQGLYRTAYFDGWVDAAGQRRNGGLAHFFVLEFTIEARSGFARASGR